jgi:hypothetical protein
MSQSASSESANGTVTLNASPMPTAKRSSHCA